MPFCPSVLHWTTSFWCVETNIFIFPQEPTFVTLRDVVTITGLHVIGSNMIKKLGKFETSQTPTLNATPSFCTRLFDNVSTANKLSLEEEHKYFLWSFLGQFIFSPSFGKPIVDLCSIVAAGHKFCLAQIPLGICYRAMRKAVLMEPFQEMVGVRFLL